MNNYLSKELEAKYFSKNGRYCPALSEKIRSERKKKVKPSNEVGLTQLQRIFAKRNNKGIISNSPFKYEL